MMVNVSELWSVFKVISYVGKCLQAQVTHHNRSRRSRFGTHIALLDNGEYEDKTTS